MSLRTDIEGVVKKGSVDFMEKNVGEVLNKHDPLINLWAEEIATQIINLIESVIKESMVKELGKLEHNKRFFHKGIHVVAVSSIEERLAGLKGEYIKSKLIGEE